MTTASPSSSSSFPALRPSGVWVAAPREQATGRALEYFKDMGGSGVIVEADLSGPDGSIQEPARLARSLGMRVAVSLDLESLRRHSTDASENPLFGEIEEYCGHLLLTVNGAPEDEAVLKQASVRTDAAPYEIPRLLDELLPGLRRYVRVFPEPERIPEWLPEIAAELGPHGFMVDRPPYPDVSWRGPEETIQLVEELRERLGDHSPVFYAIPFMTPEEGAQAQSLVLPIAAALAEQDVRALVVGMFEFQEVSWVPGVVSLLQGFPASLPADPSGSTPADEDAEDTGPRVAEEPEPAPPAQGVNATILSDRPIGPEALARPDRLGHSVYAAALYQLVTHEDTSLPLSLAVSAPWGSGKSSIMRWLQYELDWHREGTDHRCTVIPGWESNSGEPARRGTRRWPTEAAAAAWRGATKAVRWAVRRPRTRHPAAPEPSTAGGDNDDELPLTRRCKTVWIDAWKYEDSTALWAALTREIYQQARRQMGGPAAQYKFSLALGAGVVGENPGWWQVMRAAARQRLGSAEGWATTLGGLGVAAAGVLLWMTDALEALQGLGVLGGGLGASIGASLMRVKGFIRQPFSVDLDKSATQGGQAAYTPSVGDDIDRLVHLVAPGKDEALVIFVDDLDRCSPDRVKDAVEAINLLFNDSASSRTVFVLGMDVDMVAASLSVAYRPIIGELRRRESAAAGDFGFRFLSKIVQLSFTIPGPREPELDSFLNELIGEGEVGMPPADGNGRAKANAAGASPEADGGAVPKAAMSQARREAVHERVRQEAEGRSGPATGMADLLDAAEEVAEDADESEREEVEEAALDYARRENLRWLRNDAPAVQQAIRYGAPILPPRPRDYKRFVNAVRLQFLVANQSYRHGRAMAAPEQIGKWTALGMRWPVLAEEIRKRPTLLGELEEWADGESAAAPDDALWPRRVRQLVADPGLRPALKQPPKLHTTELHGLLSVH